MSHEFSEEPEDPELCLEVPFTALTPEALRGVLESVILREGTDYGEHERTLEDKCA